MSEFRPGPRVTTDMSVRVWEWAATSRPFSQHVQAPSITGSGALLSGLEYELRVGDVIGIQYTDNKSGCKMEEPAHAGADLPPPPEPNHRRRFPRHRISFPLEIRDEHVNTPMRINATDISGNGGCVETILTLALGTTLGVDFWMNSEKITTSAVVRTSDPGVRNGAEFMSRPGRRETAPPG
jgi:hypothetical protein